MLDFWPYILLGIMAIALGAGTSFALGGLFRAKLKARRVRSEELEEERRTQFQAELDGPPVGDNDE